MTSELSEQSKRRFITLNFAETQPGGSVITVKDSAGNEVASYTASPSQTFRSLSLSVPEIKDGTYTVYDGDGTQLKHSGQPQGGMGMMPRSFEPGEMPEMPEGFQPGEMPKMPEGFQPGQRPEMPEWFQPGQMPEMPEGFQPGQRPEMPGNFQPGQRPEMPEGFQPGQMPDFAEGSADQNPRKRDNAAANEASAEFIVSAESNTFNNVSPTEAEIQQ
jgi:hypothetical protein